MQRVLIEKPKPQPRPAAEPETPWRELFYDPVIKAAKQSK